MVSTRTPDAEFDVTEELVQSLLAEQFPALSRLDIKPLTSGWDNTMFRLGEDLIVRLPRRQLGADLILNEQRWLPVLAPRLPLPVPAPIHVGSASDQYPWSWSIAPWAPGQPGDTQDLRTDQAVPLGTFLSALHQPAPDDAPTSAFRGMPLAERSDIIEDRLARVAAATDLVTPAVKTAYQAALDAPMATEKTWVHGDLHPRNIVVEDGRLSSIIDWGDMNGGDGATDLAAFWMLFDDAADRAAGLEASEADSAMIDRGRGWAVFFGSILADIGLNGDERFLAVGARTLRNLSYSV